MSIPASIQRNQEAVAFVRQEWVNAIPGTPAGFDLTIERAFLHGTSFGQGMSGILGLLMPTTFDGSTEWIADDIGYWNGDHWEITTDCDVALNRGVFTAATNNYFPELYAFIDQLGCRFDEPAIGVQPWDMAALSMNWRPLDVKIPLVGHIGDNETQFPSSWSNSTPAANPAQIQQVLYRHRAHPEAGGVIPGINEYAIYDGGEYARIKQLAIANETTNPFPRTRNRLVPSTPPPTIPGTSTPLPPYPDPYSHTLRPKDVAPPASMPAVLSEFDLRNGMSESWRPSAWDGGKYRHPGVNPTNNRLRAIGQGTWLGYRDQMRVADLDADGRLAVVFGNLEGYVHMLEFAGVNDPGDPYRLVDEWRSPYLGRGVFACDATFASSGSTAGKATLYFADSLGQIHKIVPATSFNQYNYQGVIAAPPPSSPPPSGPQYLYEGSTPLLLVGNFDGGSGGSEILVMNRYFDWSLFTTAGAPLTSSGGRLPRHGRGVGVSDAFVSEIADGDAVREVMIGAPDGMVWMLDRDDDGTGTWEWSNPIERIIPFTGIWIAKAVPCHFNGISMSPSHVLIFGERSDQNDVDPSIPTGVVQLWKPAINNAAPELVAELHAGGFDETMSFTWLSKPGSQSSLAACAVAVGTTIGKYTIDVNAPPASSLFAGPSVDILAEELEKLENVDLITSLERVWLDSGSGARDKDALVFATSKGRIFVYDTGLLEPLRSAAQEIDPATPGLPTTDFNSHWPSNRTLAQTPACTSVTHGGGNADFHFAETALHFRNNASGASRRYRIGSVSLGAGNVNSWNGWVTEAKERSDWMDLAPQFLRTLVHEDIDPAIPGSEFRLFAEVGCAFLDDGTGGLGVVREFQSSSFEPIWMGIGWTAADKGPWGYFNRQGGYVFERTVRPQGVDKQVGKREYGYLGGFTVPKDATRPFFDSTNGGSVSDAWWYPQKTAARMTGQIASTNQSAHPLTLGASMKVGKFWAGGDPETTEKQVVIGTSGGYVYTIRPGATPITPTTGLIPSVLHHASPHLGSYVVGLDVGDLDEDADDEIVCGTWLDNGTFDDWRNAKAGIPAAQARNRGHLYILDPQHGSAPATMAIVADLQGDDLVGPGNGISSGVFGVKLDDVDGDGDKEIWCGDAAGRIYLFGNDEGPVAGWRCIFRSGIVARYTGAYNNLHPVKGEAGVTVKLLVQAPGYLTLFSVANGLVAAELGP